MTESRVGGNIIFGRRAYLVEKGGEHLWQRVLARLSKERGCMPEISNAEMKQAAFCAPVEALELGGWRSRTDEIGMRISCSIGSAATAKCSACTSAGVTP